ncbi:hypothetical protein CYMTET_11939 [Cymbomonas tetramitiformis]|uniref:Tyrosinase copper-binding domain-containing protein n=1 Tax=Cymbomonas tetramitiformis TaxID=36881 RepID=A0AAE0GLI5_9CHLO|nr:hypothetical protein CYMTET_11939 [Cymbomonas tetramitiformis]|eukprot:gene16889-20066_t
MHAWAICNASSCVDPSGDAATDYAHGTPALAPWHRVFVSYVESEIEDILDDGLPFGFPYWPWYDPAATARLFSPEILGSNGDPKLDFQVTDSAFASLPVFNKEGREGKTQIQRRFGRYKDVDVLSTRTDVDFCLDKIPYDVFPYTNKVSAGFRGCLEGWFGLNTSTTEHTHNRAHLWVGGTMIPTTLSPSDPAFFFLHSFVDKIYDQWIVRHSGAPYLPERGAPLFANAREPLRPWLPLRTPTQVHRPGVELGHIYT